MRTAPLSDIFRDGDARPGIWPARALLLQDEQTRPAITVYEYAPELTMLRGAIRSAGVDRAVFFSLLNKVTVISFSVVTLALVVTYFTPDRQGYYYTFTSLLVLQAFLELGMGIVLTQFVSHEWSKLHFDESGHLTGDPLALGRVGALVRVGLKWYLCAAVIFLLSVGPVGMFLLTRHTLPKGVLAPWWLLCTGVSVSILQVPLRSFLEGSNQVAYVQKIATGIFAGASIAGWIAIISGLQLYTLAIIAGFTAALGSLLYGRACIPFLRLTRPSQDPCTFSWSTEFWPQQWRIAVSWISGFFVFQSFVPILFYYQGPVVAGQMGASLQIYNAINAIALSWINAKGPKMGMLGAAGKMPELKSMVRQTLVHSRVAAICGVVFVLTVIWVMRAIHFKADRFIGVGSLSVLLAVVVVLQQSNIETLAVRFQKIEPFVLNSVVSAVLVCASNIAMSKYSGTFGVCLGFAFVVIVITVPWIHRLYGVHIGAVDTTRRNGKGVSNDLPRL